MQTSGSKVKAGFRKALISEAAKEAEALINLCENPFQEIEIACNCSNIFRFILLTFRFKCLVKQASY